MSFLHKHRHGVRQLMAGSGLAAIVVGIACCNTPRQSAELAVAAVLMAVFMPDSRRMQPSAGKDFSSYAHYNNLVQNFASKAGIKSPTLMLRQDMVKQHNIAAYAAPGEVSLDLDLAENNSESIQDYCQATIAHEISHLKNFDAIKNRAALFPIIFCALNVALESYNHFHLHEVISPVQHLFNYAALPALGIRNYLLRQKEFAADVTGANLGAQDSIMRSLNHLASLEQKISPAPTTKLVKLAQKFFNNWVCSEPNNQDRLREVRKVLNAQNQRNLPLSAQL